MNKIQVRTRSLNVFDKSYHVLEWNNNLYDAYLIRSKIIEVLKENETLFYQVNDNKIYTNDAGLFHVQMELINDIELV